MMPGKKWHWAVVILLLAGSVYFTVSAYLNRWAEQETLAKTDLFNVQLARDIDLATEKLRTLESQRLELREKKEKKLPEAATENARKGDKPRPSLFDLIKNDPTLQAHFLESGRTRIKALYRPFVQNLHLNEQQSRSFENNLALREEQLLDLVSVAPKYIYMRVDSTDHEGTDLSLELNRNELAKDHSPEGNAVASTLEKIDDEFRSAQIALIGQDGFQQFQTYERSLPVQSMVNHLGGILAFTDTPLTSDQSVQLTRAVAELSEPYHAGRSASLASIDWEAAINKSSGVLSPAQVEKFKSLVAREQNMNRLGRIIDTADIR